MKIKKKLFSKKEDYKNGSETEHQIRTRKNGAGMIAGGSALGGSLIGGSIAFENANSKAHDITTKAYKRHLARLIAVDKAMKATSNRVKPQDTGEYIKLLEAVNNKLDNSLKAVQKFDRSSKKIVEKATKKGAVKGALIGTAVGGGLAYLANKEAKKTNMRINKARRNKNKSSVEK